MVWAFLVLLSSLLCVGGVGPSPAAAQVCAGDCIYDTKVTVDESSPWSTSPLATRTSQPTLPVTPVTTPRSLSMRFSRR